MTAVMAVHAVGFFASLLAVLPWRAGLLGTNPHREGVDWREFLLGNIPFFLLLFFKASAWELVLVAWLVQGRPPSPWIATTRLRDKEVRQVLRRPEAESAGLV